MKKCLALSLAVMLLLCACGRADPADHTTREITGEIVDIVLEGQNVTFNGDGVYTSRDIVYYENKTHYESGNPYGEGKKADMHTAEDAAQHLVVNITAPGNYRLSGKLDKGQIRIDLGKDAYEDPNAVVNLILDGADITCTVAPAILFRNVYECDGNWSKADAKPDVDTSAAGANLILAENSVNTVSGSYVAKIYKDKEGEKKLVKEDGAVYSYMSMNVYGPGSLDINAENEGMDTELHLTIYGGNIAIRSGNDGINTNEDGVSVTTIRGGQLRILAGLADEGDGIDSNGYLVIHGGTVISAAHPASDAGLDSDLGSFIHGGTVIALGSAMDWAESDSLQVTMNLQFAQEQTGEIRITKEDGTELFCFDPASDPVLGEYVRSYRGAIISCPQFQVGDTCHVFADGLQMAYTGTDVMRHPGGMSPGEGGQRPDGGIHIPEDRDPDKMPAPPESDVTLPPQPPTDNPAVPQGQMPPGGPGHQGSEPQASFYMQDKVNFFSGLTPVQQM